MRQRSHSLVKPVITEKSTLLKEKQGVLCFEVSRRATKIEIRRAVEEQYKVKVATVRTVRVPGKVTRVGRFEGRKPGPGAIGSRQYELFRGFFVDEVAHSLKRDDKVMFPVTIRCLPDTTKATGEEYGLVTDV